jgi:hypothetical protein
MFFWTSAKNIQYQLFVFAVVFVKISAFVVNATMLYQDVYIIRFITVLSIINFCENEWHIIFFSLETHRQGSVSRLLM